MVADSSEAIQITYEHNKISAAEQVYSVGSFITKISDMWLKCNNHRTPVTISRKLSSKQHNKVAFLLFLLHSL